MPLRRRRDLVIQEIELSGESLLVDAAGGRAAVLNEMAAVVWLLCDGARDAQAISSEIASNLNDPALEKERLLADVTAILGEFAREGLVG